jgi:hypothetical protein
LLYGCIELNKTKQKILKLRGAAGRKKKGKSRRRAYTYDMHKKGDGQFTGEVQRLIPRARAGKWWEINGVKCVIHHHSDERMATVGSLDSRQQLSKKNRKVQP